MYEKKLNFVADTNHQNQIDKSIVKQQKGIKSALDLFTIESP